LNKLEDAAVGAFWVHVTAERVKMVGIAVRPAGSSTGPVSNRRLQALETKERSSTYLEGETRLPAAGFHLRNCAINL
jgi:hypothetical protein